MKTFYKTNISKPKEYGGYLPLDISPQGEYFDKIDSARITRFNAARYAIINAFNQGNFQKLWLPIYTCQSVYEAIESAGIHYETYNINTDFEPDLESIYENECILITNYYGQKNQSFYSQMISRYRNIIFDNTQSFFIDPIFKNGVYNVYSPRKFVGVSDGAYLISKELKEIDILEQDISSYRAIYLLKSLEEGTNASYPEYLQAEEELANAGMRSMSLLTQSILKNIDYTYVHKTRAANYRYINEKIGKWNQLTVNDNPKAPMVYPLLIEDENLRAYLIEHKVYVPQWWKWVLDNPKANAWERKLSQYLFPLPIDQRYMLTDINDICNLLSKYYRRV